MMAASASSAARPVSGLFSKVYRDILDNKAQLPSMPHVALRIRAAMQQDNYSVEKVSRVIEADPGTAAYLIAVGNSPIYRGRVPTTNVQTAVSRFGMEVTRNLVMGYALRAMFTTRSQVLARMLQHTWRESAKLAALSSVIAQHVDGVAPDQALLAGLLQDIGVLPMLKALEGHTPLTEDAPRVWGTLESFADKIGPVLLTHWGFDDAFIEVARSRKDWFRDPHPHADLADLVLVSRLCASHGKREDQPYFYEVPAYRKLGLQRFGSEELVGMLQDAASELNEVMSMLGV